MPTVSELRLDRLNHNLCDVQRMLARRALCLLVRYTKKQIVVIYKA